MRHALIVAALALATGAAPAMAGDKRPVDPNKPLCRSVEQTGSIMTHRVCHTRAEWATLSAQDSKNKDAMVQSNGLQSPSQQGTGY